MNKTGDPKPPKHDKPQGGDAKPPTQEPGTNEVEHEPDPNAEPIADGTHKYVPRSPYTAGNT